MNAAKSRKPRLRFAVLTFLSGFSVDGEEKSFAEHIASEDLFHVPYTSRAETDTKFCRPEARHSGNFRSELPTQNGIDDFFPAETQIQNFARLFFT